MATPEGGEDGRLPAHHPIVVPAAAPGIPAPGRAEIDLSPARDPGVMIQALGSVRRAGMTRPHPFPDSEDMLSAPAALRRQVANSHEPVYPACHRNHNIQQLRVIAGELCMAGADLENLLRRLVEGRLVVTADGRYLSLAIPAGKGAA